MNKNKNKLSGFTLVEMAIVILIVGVLIVAVLKGSAMITQSKIAGTISDIKTIESSIATFKLKYNDLPGDIQGPSTRLGSRCSAAPCSTPGNRDGRINGAPNTVPGLNGEGTTAFAHLAAAGLFSLNIGVDVGGGNHGFSNSLPSSKLGGGYWLSSTSNGQLHTGFTGNALGGHYLVHSKLLQDLDFADRRQGIRASHASQIDRKLDDGFPMSGEVWAGGRLCREGTDYREREAQSSCNLFIKVM